MKAVELVWTALGWCIRNIFNFKKVFIYCTNLALVVLKVGFIVRCTASTMCTKKTLNHFHSSNIFSHDIKTAKMLNGFHFADQFYDNHFFVFIYLGTDSNSNLKIILINCSAVLKNRDHWCWQRANLFYFHLNSYWQSSFHALKSIYSHLSTAPLELCLVSRCL